MESIAVIDDNAEMRSTIAGLIRHELAERDMHWNVVDLAPFSELEEYTPWLMDNDIRVLVLDEKLSGSVGEAGVEYAGHDIAKIVRDQVPDLPQVIITAVQDDELNDAAAELDAIVPRNDFVNQPGLYVERMLRMGRSYLERHEAQLAEFGLLVRAAAEGRANGADMERLEAIRMSTQSAFSIGEITTSREWLTRAEEVRSKLIEAVNILRSSRN